MNDKWKFIVLGLFVLLTRIPFLNSGYGIDGDAWSVAITASEINTTGEYSASRLPGYPVHEYLCSLFVNAGPAGLNGISAFFSVVAVIFFALILSLLRFKKIFLASVAFSCVPAFFIHSTTAIDYVIALAFIMISMYFLLKGKIILAGIFLGLAIGTRITSGAMILPFSILISNNEGLKKNIQRILQLIIPALLTGIILFLPVILKYGGNFFTYYNVPYPSIPKVLYKFSLEVWGIIGFAGLLISTALLFLPNRITSKKFLFPRSVNVKHVIAWLVAIDLYIIAFLKLPMESGYLIPIIPFVIFIFGKYLYVRAFNFLCIMLIASAAFCSITPEERFDGGSPSEFSFVFRAASEKLVLDVLKGPVTTYEARRKNGVQFVNNLLVSTDTIRSKAVIVSGRWYNQMVVQCKDTSELKVEIRDYLDEPEALFFYAKGYTIYYLPKQDFYNKIMRNVDLEIYKAIPYLEKKKI
jgi:hypothetical protein